MTVLIRWTDLAMGSRGERDQFLKTILFLPSQESLLPHIKVLFTSTHHKVLLKPLQGEILGRERAETALYPIRHRHHNSFCDELEVKKPKSNTFCPQTTAVSKFTC